MPKSSDRQLRSLAVSAAIMLFAAGSAVVLARPQGGASPIPSPPGGWESAATWIAALGTAVLAVVAIFQETIRGWFYRPKFQVSVKTEPPDCVMVPIIARDGSFTANAVYLRLWVENTGNATGRNVEVYAMELRCKRMDENWERVGTFPRMNLRWANDGTVFFPSIAPAMGKHCDVAHITDPSKREQLGESLSTSSSQNNSTLLVFDLMVTPNHRGNIVQPGTYELDILVAADNVQPMPVTLSIILSGDWYPSEIDMLRDGIGIGVRGDA